MVCFGAGGTAVQVMLDLVYQAAGESLFAGYVADNFEGRMHADGNPVHSLEEVAEWDDVGIIVPLHEPGARRGVYNRIHALGIPILGFRGLPHLSHPAAELGEGVLASTTTHIGFSTVIGRGVLALSDLVAHDVTVGEFTTLAMHSIVLGHVEIGKDVFIGAGAVIRNGTRDRPLRIGDGAVVGAGAVVHRDVPAGEIVVSQGARPLAEFRS